MDLNKAVALCTEIEQFAPDYGAHIGLTGGYIYKLGSRKDLDIVVYRIRNKPEIDVIGFINRLNKMGFSFPIFLPEQFVIKASFNRFPVDFLFPENKGTEYPSNV